MGMAAMVGCRLGGKINLVADSDFLSLSLSILPIMLKMLILLNYDFIIF